MINNIFIVLKLASDEFYLFIGPITNTIYLQKQKLLQMIFLFYLKKHLVNQIFKNVYL